ncbi:SPASM domain-containing protein [Paenibacillus sp. FSL H3-0457]|uniref:radical SAM/SPASM domain-containing protein n=1 Tax=Paenibacillus sp. FSL H3-0457 TaxID=2921430 RepID=UPI0030EB939F
MNLSKLSILSFEIGNECNLTKQHPKCPINIREYKEDHSPLTTEIIVKSIEEAEKFGFKGHVAFHFYNEPLLYKDRIEEVIDAKPDSKYLLWSNGLLLNPKIEDNQILKKFEQVVITCYYSKKMDFFNRIKEYYGNVEIATWELDDRINIYSNKPTNVLGCKRVQFELPIDYYGNVHLCCRDWNNSYEIGNIVKDGFESVVMGSAYQNAVQSVNRRLLDLNSCPGICKSCDDPWLRIESVGKTESYLENKNT